MAPRHPMAAAATGASHVLSAVPMFPKPYTPFTNPWRCEGKYFGNEVTPTENTAPAMPKNTPPTSRSADVEASLRNHTGAMSAAKLAKKTVRAPNSPAQ